MRHKRVIMMATPIVVISIMVTAFFVLSALPPTPTRASMPPTPTRAATSTFQCQRTPWTAPAWSNGGIDQRMVCQYTNVCYHRKSKKWLWPVSTNPRPSRQDRPFLSPDGEQLLFFDDAKDETHIHHSGTFVLWQPTNSVGGDYYQVIVQAFGAMFWLLHDFSPSMLLWTHPPSELWLYLTSLVMPLVRTTYLGELPPNVIHCFDHLIAGAGGRSFLWNPVFFPFQPPFFVDFMELNATVFQQSTAAISVRPFVADSVAPYAILRKERIHEKKKKKKDRITFIGRAFKRRVTNWLSLLAALAVAFPDTEVIVMRDRGRVALPPMPPGVEIVEYDWGDAGAQLKQDKVIRDTTVMIGAHGAGLSNLMFLPLDARGIVELVGHAHQNVVFEVLAAFHSVPYSIVRPKQFHNEQCAELYSSACKNHDFAVSIPHVVDAVRKLIPTS